MKPRDGPSRQRRRAKRAAARQKVLEESEAGKEAEDLTHLKDPIIDSEVVENDDQNDEPSETVVNKTAEVAEVLDEEVLDEEVLGPSVKDKTKDTAAFETREIVTDHAVGAYPAEVITIYATAVVEDSPNATLANDELESIYRFIASKDHLVKNISAAQACHVSSREFRNSKFKHTLDVKIFVKTANLWEGARNFIWLHLGSGNIWSRGNGLKITLVKIHQK